MYKLLSTLIYLVVVVFRRKLKVVDKQYLPKNPGYMVTCTHQSMVEIIVLAMAVYPGTIHYMAKKELFKTKFLNWLFTSVGAFPVNRENPGPSTLKIPVKLLKDNKTVGMFPSGSRNAGAPIKKGAATIAVMSKKPIIPAVYEGPLTFKDLLFSKEKAYIQFGEAIEPTAYKMPKTEAIAQITDDVDHCMKRMSEQLKKRIK
ncbi:1-acyl-sn-glycerol-3-phosphate acyltransferase [Macrococcus hajekii]|uniref:1-acyl-sn-glycerol-3-phosphate acyltransferase n=1 Tax=Macrococcus hajekii TaxID=198482 RepID=A0A4R6BLK8_9STAP|nr:lysophospholipid acyltransferase family protein [Macrococcus hajekii]TDM02680.1 1-acyl-sn-glycerol-3-phosphate acyltransferase [Macrococcus hajekii]GGB03007.1 1-acyl-sn-glycerol-3-phosphate acyltransferase [Macrococcus hajekii]